MDITSLVSFKYRNTTSASTYPPSDNNNNKIRVQAIWDRVIDGGPAADKILNFKFSQREELGYLPLVRLRSRTDSSSIGHRIFQDGAS